MTTPVPIAFPEGESIVSMIAYSGAIFVATNVTVYKIQDGTHLVPLKLIVDDVPEIAQAVTARVEKVERQKQAAEDAALLALAAAGPDAQAKK